MISCSLMGREKREISSKLLILPSLTRRPSLVTGIHSFSSFPRPPRPRPRPRPPRSPRPRPPRPRSPNPPRNPPRSPPPAGAASAIFVCSYLIKCKNKRKEKQFKSKPHLGNLHDLHLR